ncbi:succinate dehydrogenase cytochrome b subunit [Flavobacterium gawalongense]|uniref:Succinate dehydrogenase cytochrome b subunit n=1 Tax=Flavobacterium gawalongense TaxID=2594432 RepID=A0A553BTV6_9FLAO|nr:succinate dehydrogenase cytochrome b subunit [Flavobacterium gawalongense]TRX02264.1 succinate dehydrogenase cytochrome b subunit [Flavobacterium gawalongense]TRX07492.1 succinate dehydrogenase cytochrome b subunit [Flavobacterium gawalongense]TRX11665.1 succinate dehydrogenase cytochrome b subunit [Flavobacterium gawalongense]TRX12332.1 succinate dehydrogenase cytochrome b subunit [Flavobacterium gawalongense]TRX30403.1 succinate dehydrogenase cytochrome b subunit [Flavobacterium gawalonge
MAKSALLKSSIAKKVAMALSGLFLMLFLAQHFFINMTSVFSSDTFNSISHYMGNNPLVQFVIQPILIVGVIFHFIMGFVLDFKNRSARPIAYAKNNGAANSSWASRNMIVTGSVVLAFIALHFYDFWFPEMVYKYVDVSPLNETRYFHEMTEKFESPVRTALYSISFLLLSLHLWHGFNSSFQSVGFNNKYSKSLHTLGYAFAIVVPFGFIFIALFHHFNH